MNIIGISLGNLASGHDTSACLLKNQKIVCAAEEERFTRNKHEKNFPINAVHFCLQEGKITLEEVDHFAIASGPRLKTLAKGSLNFLKNSPSFIKPHSWWQYGFGIKRLLNYATNNTSSLKQAKKELGSVFFDKLERIEHHTAHLASAYRLSGFKESMSMTIDSRGEACSTRTGFYENEEFKKVSEMTFPNSLGNLYLAFGQYLGLGGEKIQSALDSSGKLMGLSSYGKPNIDISDIIKTTPTGYKVNANYLFEGKKRYSNKLVGKFGPPRKPESEIRPLHENLAYALQKKLEESALKLLEILKKHGESQNLCMSGGVSLNCLMNSRLLNTDGVKEIFIQPGAGDMGLCLGAVAESFFQKTGKNPDKLENAYLGPEYGEKQILRVLENEKRIVFEKSKNVSSEAADLLSEGKILGWFQGRMELGPRALGARSILCDPSDPKMKDTVNNKVKFREPWRPFAPSILNKAKEEYFENAYPSPYMVLSFTVKKNRQKEIPSVVHVDGTTRPQTVEKNTNPPYFELIKKFEKNKGVPLVLNTSFNVRGEPIVCRPQEAVETLLKTEMDYLIIGDYVARKTN